MLWRGEDTIEVPQAALRVYPEDIEYHISSVVARIRLSYNNVAGRAVYVAVVGEDGANTLDVGWVG